MPPRPFPLQLNVGTDICHTTRIYNLITRGGNTTSNLFRFLRQFLTAREQEAFVSRHRSVRHIKDSIRTKDYRPVNYLAGRWAAKEATIKAFAHRALSFKDIQILSSPSGTVYAMVLDKPASSIWPQGALLPTSSHTSNDDVRERDRHEPDVTEDGEKSASTPARRDSVVKHLGSMEESDFTPFHLQDDNLPGQIAKISISHDGEYATAVCLAAEEPRAGDVGGEAAAREP